MKPYGQREHIGLHQVPEDCYCDIGDLRRLGHASRNDTKNGVRKQMKKTARNAAKRDVRNSLKEE